MFMPIVFLSTFLKISLASEDAGNTTSSKELEKIEYEIMLPNGLVYGVPLNPAFWHLRGAKPLRNVTVSDDPKKLGRVIGGGEAVRGEVPYQVGLMLLDWGLSCGGSIYSRDTVLTAAHCFFEGGKLLPPSEFAVAVGKTQLALSEEFEMVRAVKEIILHPQYVPTVAGYNDLAIVRLKRPLCFNVHIQPIPSAPKNFMPAGDLTISGWGYTGIRQAGDPIHPDNTTTKLKIGKVRMVPPDKCAQQYEKLGIDGSIGAHESIICAGVPDGSTDTCQGDSGGPLACPDEKGDLVLCGIVSTGIGCGQANSPAIYTNVSFFHDWILSTGGLPGDPCV